MGAKLFLVKLTRKELDALGEACGFRLAGDLEDLDDEGAALERAHEALGRATPVSQPRQRKGE